VGNHKVFLKNQRRKNMEKYCFICGKELGQFSFVVIIEVGEEVEIVDVCEGCGYTITKEKGC